MSFSGKVVLVTGGSSGIGAAASELFVKEGASVAIVGRNEAKLNSVAQRCQQHGAAPLVIRADVAKDEEASTIVQQTVDRFGKLDVLINNAGVVDGVELQSEKIMESYDKVMNTNLRAVVHITSLAMPHLKKSKGNIINISSICGTKVCAMLPLYCVSKAGLEHFSRVTALDLAQFGVRVNIVSPGPVVTDILESAGLPNMWEQWGKETALRKVAASEEVGDLLLFLASEKAKSITGANFSIDNGESLV